MSATPVQYKQTVVHQSHYFLQLIESNRNKNKLSIVVHYEPN